MGLLSHDWKLLMENEHNKKGKFLKERDTESYTCFYGESPVVGKLGDGLVISESQGLKLSYLKYLVWACVFKI